LKYNIRPIFCVGETLAERKNGKTQKVVKQQLDEGLKGIEIMRLSLLRASLGNRNRKNRNSRAGRRSPSFYKAIFI